MKRHLFLTILALSMAKVSPEEFLDDDEDVPQILLNHNDSEIEEDDQETNETMHFVPGSSKKLTEYLLSKHNVNAPPDGLVFVDYELELVHVLGIDELKQTMTVLIYVDEHWKDSSLSWDPALYGGITKTWLPMDKVWVPDIIVFNMVETSRLAHEDLLSAVRAPVRVHYNGTLVASHPAVHTVSCEINIKHFPLDDQRCAIEIASWAYGREKIRLHARTDHSLQHYKKNEEWHLLGINVSEGKYEHEGTMVSEMKFEIAVKRRPLFYMVTLTFPSYVMCAISVVGLFARFSTTGEREERFTLGVTAILTMAVLSLVVSEKVPHSSTHVPLLVAYFLFNMVIVSVAAMTTGLVMNIHRMGRYGDEPSDFWLKVFLIKSWCKRPRKRKYKMNPEDPNHVVLVSETKNGDINSKVVPAVINFNGAPKEEQGMNDRIDALEQYLRKIIQRCEHWQEDLDALELREDAGIRKIKTNGYVRISERLDIIFMTFFLSVVTIPVVVLFYLS